MIHAMLDTETLGVSGNMPTLLTISALTFNPYDDSLYRPGNIETFHMEISPESCTAYGSTIDPSTVMWWLGQNDDARELIRGEKDNKQDIKHALGGFTYWYERNNCEGIWSHGKEFDIQILETYIEKILGEKDIPWKFRDKYDTRTLYQTAIRYIEKSGNPLPEKFPYDSLLWDGVPDNDIPRVKHHGLYDAWSQALAVQRCHRILKVC